MTQLLKKDRDFILKLAKANSDLKKAVNAVASRVTRLEKKSSQPDFHSINDPSMEVVFYDGYDDDEKARQFIFAEKLKETLLTMCKDNGIVRLHVTIDNAAD